MKQHFKLIPAVYVFLTREDEVLLLRRINTGYGDGKWSIPAGHLDGDESAASGMIREIKEEIGVDARAQDLKLVHVMHRNGRDGGVDKENERMDFFFVLTQWSGEPKNSEPDKCGGLEWFPTSNLPEDLLPYVRQVWNDYQNHNFYSEQGF